MTEVAQHAEPRDASLGELIGLLSEQTTRLVRDEMALAKTELQSSVKHVGIGAGFFGGAGVVAMLGLVTLVGSAVAALSLLLEVWLAALIVAALLFAIAAVSALMGKKQIGRAGPPKRAISSVKQDLAEVKGRTS